MRIWNGLAQIPLATPECMLLLATVAFKSKSRYPLRVEVIERQSCELADESRHITRLGLPIRCL
jgi:hypothetical protein